MASKRAPHRWRKVSTLDTIPQDGRRVCAACRTDVRSYQYRYYPAESSSYERCIGLSWCSTCRLYTGAMVYVPRDTVLPDRLASLPPEQREHLERSEARLIDYLDSTTEEPE